MKIEIVKLSKVKNNPDNPRIIKDENFEKLVKSVKEFPEMLEIRPIVVNEGMIVLGGNMRLKACKEAGLKEIPIIKASELTEEQQKEFIIKDNVSGGEWQWDALSNEWNPEELKEWGLDVPVFPEDVDYTILDSEDLDDEMEEMAGGVKKAIQIEFEPDHYEEAYEVVKFFRNEGAYVGKMILDFLNKEKAKL